MRYIDLHCDTLSRLYWGGVAGGLPRTQSQRIFSQEPTLWKNPYQVDLQRLRHIRSLVQTFAIFIDTRTCGDGYPYIRAMLDDVHAQIQTLRLDARLIGNTTHLQRGLEDQRVGILLAVEDGGGIAKHLDTVYELGVRMVTLVWNHFNGLGFPASHPKQASYGLTAEGFQLVEAMNAKKMIVDVSHLSDRGFDDVVQTSTYPVLASHSNAREIWPHPRNLTDRMIRTLGQSGGLIGLNFCSRFVGPHGCTAVEWLSHHMKHLLHVGGSDVLALGSDYDGIDNVTAFGDVSGLPLFMERLCALGWMPSVLEKIMYRNALRFLFDALPSSREVSVK